MSVEDHVATAPAPAASDTTLRAVLPEGWTTLATDPHLALQSRSPTVAVTDRLYVYGGDGCEAVEASDDGGAAWTGIVGDWAARPQPAGAAFGGHLWIVGGEGAKDTWISSDPANWTQVDANAGWGPRTGHSLVPLGDRSLVLIAGAQGDQLKNDVWAWKLGPPWQIVREQADFPPRRNAAAGALGDTLFVIGGEDASGAALGDCYVSADEGFTWLVRKQPWSARTGAAAATIGDTLYLIGGSAGDQTLREVWATKDFHLWTLVDNDPPWQALRGFGAAAVGDHLVVAGGTENGVPNPHVWALKPRPPGWSQIGQSWLMGGMIYPFVTWWNNAYWMIGGDPANPVCTSPDGINWSPAPSNLPYRQRLAGAIHDGRLYVSGGTVWSSPFDECSEVWRTDDGVTWTQMTAAAGWPPRCSHCMASYQGMLLVFCGAKDGRQLSDIWFSLDEGATWQFIADDVFEARSDATAIVFQDQLWMLGGRSDRVGVFNEVWSSVSPRGQWLQQRTPEWPPRYQHQAVVVNDTLFVVLGLGPGGQMSPDVWGSIDGLYWVPVADAAPIPGLHCFGAAPFGDSILCAGGVDQGGGGTNGIFRFLPPRVY